MQITVVCAFCGADIDPISYMRKRDELVIVVGCQCNAKLKEKNEALASLEREQD